MLRFYLHKNGIFEIQSIFFSIIRHKTSSKIIPQYSMKTAVNLSYKIYGEPTMEADDPPVLLLHGLLGTKKHWDSIGKTMVNITRRPVLSVDLRNHGDSPHLNSHKYEDLTVDILKLLDKLEIEKANLVGYSMGGRASMSVSLLAPQKVAGLLVVDISPVSESRHFTDDLPKVMAAMKKISFKKQKTIKEAKEHARIELENIINNDILLKEVLSNVKMKSDNTIGWKCNLDILIKQYEYISSFPETLRKKTYYGPTLFIGGQQSEYLPPDDLPSIREMFPRAVVTYLPQTGHNVHIEDPKTFLELAIAFIRVNLVYKVHGAMTDLPIIIIHGLLGSKKNWESMSKKINTATKKTVIAVDMRNHGNSPHAASHTYPDLAADVLLLINKLSIKRAVIIGHSMGGRTGMVLALSEPTRVDSLIVVDISPISTPGLLNNYFPKLVTAMKAVDFNNMDNITKARTKAKETLVASGSVDSESTGFILMNIGVKEDKTIGWLCNIDVLETYFNDIATFPGEMSGKKYTGRTLFIGSGRSKYLPQEDITGIRKYFPKAEIKYVQGVGHNVHAEDPAAFLSLVTQFLM